MDLTYLFKGESLGSMESDSLRRSLQQTLLQGFENLEYEISTINKILFI